MQSMSHTVADSLGFCHFSWRCLWKRSILSNEKMYFRDVIDSRQKVHFHSGHKQLCNNSNIVSLIRGKCRYYRPCLAVKKSA